MKRKGMTLYRLYLIVALLLLGAVGSTLLVSSPMARYITTATGSASARVAKFNVKIGELKLTEGTSGGTGTVAGQTQTETQTVKIDPMQPGDVREYTVTVTSNSEVAVRFRLEVTNIYSNIPLTIEVLDEEGNSIETDGAVLQAGDAETHTYTLRISWDESESDPKYAERVDILTIRMVAEQVN